MRKSLDTLAKIHKNKLTSLIKSLGVIEDDISKNKSQIQIKEKEIIESKNFDDISLSEFRDNYINKCKLEIKLITSDLSVCYQKLKTLETLVQSEFEQYKKYDTTAKKIDLLNMQKEIKKEQIELDDIMNKN